MPSPSSSDSEYSPGEQDRPESGPSAPSYAPFRSFPKATYASVEYPSTVSHPAAILRLVTQEDIDECFNAPPTESPQLEMRYGNMDRAGVPVRGTRVPSQKLLLKLTRRRRRRYEEEDDEGDEGNNMKGQGGIRIGAEEGIFTSEIVGPITQTVRFRAMADYHYTPDPNGRVSSLVQALKDTDYDMILDYKVPVSEEAYLEETTPPPDADEDYQPQYRSILDLQPLPIFSERKVPLIYNYKNHSATIEEDYYDEKTGKTIRRHINRGRFIGYALTKVSQNAPLGAIPMAPPKALQERLNTLDPALMHKLRDLFLQRPVWLRRALLAQLTDEETRLITAHKLYLPGIAYTFGAGPFWKLIVRHGYDPRQDPAAYKWQRIYFYLHVNRGGQAGRNQEAPESDEEDQEDGRKGHSEWEAEQARLVEEGKRPPLNPKRDYIFDGQILHRDLPDYQLCDIHDPLIRRYLDDPENIQSKKCTNANGWYKPPALNLVKNITRLKFMYIREKNESAPDDICYPAIEDFERGKLKEGRRRMKEREQQGEGEQDGEKEDEVDEAGYEQQQASDVEMEG